MSRLSCRWGRRVFAAAAAVFVAAGLLAVVPQAVAAAGSSGPLEVSLVPVRAEAVEGTMGHDTPARFRVQLSRKLKRGEELVVPLITTVSDASNVGLSLAGSPRGVEMKNRALHFGRNARRAVVRVHAIGDVSADRVTLSIPELVSFNIAHRGQLSHVWGSSEVRSNSGLRIGSREASADIVHLPHASIVASGGAATAGDAAQFSVSLDGTWEGPGKRPRVRAWHDEANSGSGRMLKASSGFGSLTIPVSVATGAGDSAATVTLLAAPGYWVTAGAGTATKTLAAAAQGPVQDPDDQTANRDAQTVVPQPDEGEPQPLQTEEPAPVPNSDTQPVQLPDATPAVEEPTPGTITVSHGDGVQLYPSEAAPPWENFEYCFAASPAPTASVTVTAAASPTLVTVPTVTLPAGSTDEVCAKVTATAAADDSVAASSKPITLTHSAASADASFDGIAVADYAMHLRDNDAMSVVLASTDTTAAEGDSATFAEFTLTIGRPLVTDAAVTVAAGKILVDDEALEVPLIFDGGALDDDFSLELVGAPTGVTLNGHRVRFDGSASGSATSATLRARPLDDTDGVSESVTVSMPSLSLNRVPSNPASTRWVYESTGLTHNGYLALSGTAQFTVADSAPAPAPVIPEVEFVAPSATFHDEDAGTITATLTLDVAPTAPLTVSYKYNCSRCPTFGSDYTIPGGSSSGGTVTVPAGSTSVDIPITILDDDADENLEYIKLKLTAGTGYTLGWRDFWQAIIRDNDDFAASVSISLIPNRPVDEGDETWLVVQLSTATPTAVTIPLVFDRGTAENGDVLTTIRRVTIPAWNTNQAITVVTTRDSDSDDEKFTVSIGSPLPAGVTAGAGTSASVTINDLD